MAKPTDVISTMLTNCQIAHIFHQSLIDELALQITGSLLAVQFLSALPIGISEVYVSRQ